ncbi:hypothetical protein OC844_007657, partial [Tilletia horrida]
SETTPIDIDIGIGIDIDISIGIKTRPIAATDGKTTTLAIEHGLIDRRTASPPRAWGSGKPPRPYPTSSFGPV